MDCEDLMSWITPFSTSENLQHENIPFYHNDFVILEEVGRGGMGVVLKAHQISLERDVALKLLYPSIASSQSMIDRFHKEAKLLAKLNNPHIVPIYHFDNNHSFPFFAMEYIPGMPLSKKMKSHRVIPEKEAVRIIRQICKALMCAHGLNIIHRDIKPSNIMLQQPDGAVRVTDFGIAQVITARHAENSESTVSSAGTIGFESPEQIFKLDLDIRADIFALGVTFYYMLTGTLPFNADDREGCAVLYKENCKPLAPSQMNPKVNPITDDIVLKMIEIDRTKRYKNCREILSDLETIPIGKIIPPSLWPTVLFLFKIRKYIITLFLLVGTTILFLLLPSIINFFRDIKPFYLKIDSSLVSVFTQEGKKAWSIKVNGEIAKAELAKLYSGKPNYLIVGIRNGADSGKINVYNNKGKLLWSRQTTMKYPYKYSGINQMGIVDLVVSEPLLNNQPHIITISTDASGWFPCRLTIFDRKGNEKSTYWHPGHLSKILTFQSSKYKRQFILAWGYNNGMLSVMRDSVQGKHYQSIVCLDPETMSGEAPPHFGNIGHGIEEWYTVLLPQNARILNIKVVESTSQYPIEDPRKFEVAIKGGLYLYINEEGKMTGRAFGDGYSDSEAAHLILLDK